MPSPESRTILYAADVSVLENPALYAKAYAAASPQRREKADKYKHGSDKYLALGAEILLRYGLSQAGLSELPLLFELGEHGKPYIKDSDTFFSISHSGDWAVCAVSDSEVGCDIEKIRPVDLKLARRFSPEEFSAIMSADEENRLELFFRYWTLKESYMKATGLGLKLPLNEFQIVMEKEASVIQSANSLSYGFHEFSEISGYSCAVCTAGAACDAELKIVELSDCI